MTDERHRIRAALEDGRRALESAGIEDALRESELILARTLQVDRVRIHVDPPEPPEADLARFRVRVAARARRVPMAQVLGEAEFLSRTFRVTPAVLVPRPETEHLVAAALDELAGVAEPLVVDVGTGSGCIAVSLAVECGACRVAAVDISGRALRVARENAEAHGVADRVHFVKADLLEAVRGPVDLVVCNPPYVGEEAVAPECLHEPPEALFAGPDALVFYRRLASAVGRVLRRDGAVVVELPGARENEIAALFRKHGLRPRSPIPDLAGLPRVLVAGQGLVSK